MIEFTMPSLGADMEAATLMTWKVAAGATVKRGDVVAEVETDKGLIDIEVFHNGVIAELVAQPGQKLPVGALLATINETGTPAASHPVSAPPPPIPAAPPVPPTPAVITPPPSAPDSTHPARVSPLARKVAATLGVDLATVTGTGPGGAIERADVERAAAQDHTPPGPTPVAPTTPSAAAALPAGSASTPTPDRATAMRRAIAAAMAKSNRDIPHYYLATHIDMSLALAWLEAENQRLPIHQRLLPAALLLAAIARTLQRHPDLNGAWIDNALVRRDAVHINFAIATRQGGLITPAIHDVDKKSIHEIMAALHDLIPRAKDGGLRSSELSEGTVTVTSLGDLGVESVFGVIYPPQVALIGLGRITEQPWAENGMLDVRPILHATLAGDHRATDGRTGARFLDTFNRQLQHPESL